MTGLFEVGSYLSACSAGVKPATTNTAKGCKPTHVEIGIVTNFISLTLFIVEITGFGTYPDAIENFRFTYHIISTNVIFIVPLRKFNDHFHVWIYSMSRFHYPFDTHF